MRRHARALVRAGIGTHTGRLARAGGVLSPDRRRNRRRCVLCSGPGWACIVRDACARAPVRGTQTGALKPATSCSACRYPVPAPAAPQSPPLARPRHARTLASGLRADARRAQTRSTQCAPQCRGSTASGPAAKPPATHQRRGNAEHHPASRHGVEWNLQNSRREAALSEILRNGRQEWGRAMARTNFSPSEFLRITDRSGLSACGCSWLRQPWWR